MIRTEPALTELPGLIDPEQLRGRIKPQTPREEALVELIFSIMEHIDPVDIRDSADQEEIERLSALELRYLNGCATFKAGIEEFKMLICQVSTDHEKVAHMTEWLFKQRTVLQNLGVR